MIPQPIYVSGPMTHFPEYNRPAFCSACEELRALGYEVVSPHEVKLDINPNWTELEKWDAYMRADIALLLQAKSVVVLEHWQSSRGALLEVHIAHALKMPVVPFAILKS
jgi:hypothetical protein